VATVRLLSGHGAAAKIVRTNMTAHGDGGSAATTETLAHMPRMFASLSAGSSNEAGSRGSRNNASATQHGIEYRAIMMSAGLAIHT
jgi:hypothetical protein